MISKVCVKCTVDKPVSEFYKQNNKKNKGDYYRGVCKPCFSVGRRKWQLANADYLRALTRFTQNKRRAAQIQATPPWADLEAIRKIYSECPPGFQVDHILPLKGKTVRGLHVPHNLQYLTPTENFRKGNRIK